MRAMCSDSQSSFKNTFREALENPIIDISVVGGFDTRETIIGSM
jgi:hypothetical protein